MNWGALLYIFLVLVFFSICIPAGISAYWFWANRESADGARPIMWRLALVLGAVSYECLCRLFAAGFGFDGPKPVYSKGYAIAYWHGQLVMAIAIAILLRHLVSTHQQKKPGFLQK